MGTDRTDVSSGTDRTDNISLTAGTDRTVAISLTVKKSEHLVSD